VELLGLRAHLAIGYIEHVYQPFAQHQAVAPLGSPIVQN
jgi:hypothetical protein